MPEIAASDFSDIRPGSVYTLGEACVVTRLSTQTLRRRIKTGRLSILPRSGHEPLRVLGTDLLALLGERQAALPSPSETVTDRDLRAMKAMAEAKRLKKAVAK